MEKIKVAIVGYGNIGQYALQAVQAAEDMELVGVIRHSAQAQQPKELEGICVVDSVEKLPAKPQVALLCLPTRSVEENAKEYLAKGINTVDSFDIHTDLAAALRAGQGSKSLRRCFGHLCRLGPGF